MNREDIKSMRYTVQNNINKSLDYDLRDNFIELNGVELKDKLSAFLVKMILEKNDYFRKQEQLINQIGIEPQCSIEEYELKGFRQRIQTIPYKYGYDLIYPKAGDLSFETLGETDRSNLMLKYNEQVRYYLDLSIDSILIKTMIDGIDIEKKYLIKLEFASKIGF